MAEGDIFREIEEELKREQFARLWDRYGYLVIGAAVGIVLAVAGYKYWKNQQIEQAATFGARFSEALAEAEGKDKDKAAASLARMAAEAPRGYAALATLRGASLAAAAGKVQEAAAQYDAVARDGSLDALFRDFAGIQSAALAVDSAGYDEMKGRLAGLAEGDGSWRHTARELLGLSAYRSGELGEAEQWYNRISDDPLAPSGVKQRAEMMVSLIFQATAAKPAAPATDAKTAEPAVPGAPAVPGKGM